MIDGQSTHDAMQYLSSDSWFRWVCNDPAEIETWGHLRLVRSSTFLDAGSELMKYAPFPIALLTRWAPWLIRKNIDGYRQNRFVVET